jgi:hypothetical protein
MTTKSLRFIFKEQSHKKEELIGKSCLIYLYKIGGPKLWTKEFILDAGCWNGKTIEVNLDNGHWIVFDVAKLITFSTKADYLLSQPSGSNVEIEL